ADDADPKGAADTEPGTEADTAPVGPDCSPAQVAALVRAITLVLDDCREADAAEEERLKAVAAVHSAELHQERAGTAQGEAMDNVRRSEDACGAAREGWSAMLEGLGLGAELSPGTVREALECMERCLAAEADVARQQDDITRLTRERDALITPLRQIAKEWCNASGDTSVLPGEAAEDTDWAELLDTLLHRAQAMSEAARERKQVGCDLEEQRDRLKAATAAANDAEATVAELLRLGGADDAEGYLRRAEAVRQRADMLQRAGDLENTLSRAAGDMPLEAFLESFATVDEHEREVQLRESERQIAAMLAEEQELGAKEAALSGRITTLATADRLGGLRQQEADLRAILDSDARQWSRFALAHALIDAAKARFERERQPQVVRTAAEIFRAITDGRWAGLAASLEDNSISVVPPHGEAVPPEQLSRGTQEQIYLAMRLGHIRSHTEQAGSLPLIMDDILVNFDPERARRTAASLLRFTSGDMGGHPQQVLFFTCHPHIADMLQEIMPQSGRYAVHDGTITPA
ncbi:MAG: hypothetical protein IKH84_05635, partial [Ottowia sp.]|nr:hypothetical protein [Ottowia sp.]